MTAGNLVAWPGRSYPLGATVTSQPAWFIELNELHSSYLVLISLAALALTVGLLVYTGLLTGILRVLGVAVGWTIRTGFLLWERLLQPQV